jgi:hypothetical protein
MNKKSVKAKELSKWGIAIGTLLVIALSLIRGFWTSSDGNAFGLSVDDILKIGTFCVIVWSPVYLSMWFDKFLGKKEEDSCGTPENR